MYLKYIYFTQSIVKTYLLTNRLTLDIHIKIQLYLECFFIAQYTFNININILN